MHVVTTMPPPPPLFWTMVQKLQYWCGHASVISIFKAGTPQTDPKLVSKCLDFEPNEIRQHELIRVNLCWSVVRSLCQCHYLQGSSSEQRGRRSPAPGFQLLFTHLKLITKKYHIVRILLKNVYTYTYISSLLVGLFSDIRKREALHCDFRKKFGFCPNKGEGYFHLNSLSIMSQSWYFLCLKKCEYSQNKMKKIHMQDPQ